MNDDTVLLLFICIFTHPPVFSSRKKREKREQRGERNLSLFSIFMSRPVPRFLLFFASPPFSSSLGFEQNPKSPSFFFCGERAQKRKKKADKVWRHLPESVISYHKHKHTTHKIIMSFTLSCSTVRVNATVARSSLKVRHRNIARVVFFIRVSARS